MEEGIAKGEDMVLCPLLSSSQSLVLCTRHLSLPLGACSSECPRNAWGGEGRDQWFDIQSLKACKVGLQTLQQDSTSRLSLFQTGIAWLQMYIELRFFIVIWTSVIL